MFKGINVYLEENKAMYPGILGLYRDLCPIVECIDGFSMSVQASKRHYCLPKSDDGPYVAVEVAYPSEEEELLTPYEGSTTDPNGVYGRVPVAIVNQIIKKHRGLV